MVSPSVRTRVTAVRRTGRGGQSVKGPADAAALNGTCGSVRVNRRDSHLPGVRAATAGTLGVAGRAGLSKCPDVVARSAHGLWHQVAPG